MSQVEENYMTVVDYVIFAFMMVASVLTGLYFAYRHLIFKKKRKLDTLQDLLTGNKDLKPFPVAMSLIAAYISGVTMLGTPTEIYNYGAVYWMVIFGMMLSGLAVAFVYMPVYTKLRVASSYEYLELRFNKILRLVTSFLFLFDMILFLPMLIYVPALAFAQMSNTSVFITAYISSAICVFYTIVGGVRAVIYTDVWQTIVMFVADIIIIIVGIAKLESMNFLIEKNVEGKRLGPPDFSPSMYERFTVWSSVIGGFIYWTAYNSTNQTMIQRYVEMANDKQAKISILIFKIAAVLFVSLCCFAGLLLYAFYHDCDPNLAHRTDKSDQVLPLYVIEIAREYYGIPGIFVSGVFGAGLSSLSVSLNCCSVVFLEDFLRGAFKMEISELKAKIIAKVVILVLGIITCLGMIAVHHMGTVFEVAASLSSISAGTTYGIFSLGMLVPWCNSKGALVGAISGFLIACVTAFGNQYHVYQGTVAGEKLPLSVDGCYERYSINSTRNITEVPDQSHIFPFFRLSYLWIAPVGFVMTMLFGIITSFITGKTDLKTLDPQLISPAFRWILPEEAKAYEGTALKSIQDKRLVQNISKQYTESETTAT